MCEVTLDWEGRPPGPPLFATPFIVMFLYLISYCILLFIMFCGFISIGLYVVKIILQNCKTIIRLL